MLLYDLPIHKNPMKTREDMKLALDQLVNPIKKYFTKDNTLLNVGHTSVYYDDKAAMQEGYARPLWGIVPATIGGWDNDIWDVYLEGFIHGTDPNHDEYWGIPNNNDQLLVQMPIMALALALVPEKIWDKLNESQRENLVNWFDYVNKKDVAECNWQFFRILTNVGLKKLGARYNAEEMEESLKRIESYYLSDGWYTDGMREQRDYYVSFAIHFYSLIYVKIMEKEDTERCNRMKERACLFAKEFIYWFSNDGSSIPFGRSLTYKFAQCCFWGALAYAGVEALPWGVMKGIVLRHLRWWFKRPVFTGEGILTIGYAYTNQIVAEGYNAPGSSYWALKAFWPLAVPESHPFWQAEELPLPELKTMVKQIHPHMLICRGDGKDHVMALTSGQYSEKEDINLGAKYSKFAYSNLFGVNVPKSARGIILAAYDSMLALSECDDYYRGRLECEAFSVEDHYIYSRWKPWNNVTVQTWLIPIGPWHVRIHKVENERPLDSAEGGFSVAIEKDNFAPKENVIRSIPNGKAACYPWAISGIVDLMGEREACVVRLHPNVNLLHSRVNLPVLTGHMEPGSHWLACAVLGSPSDGAYLSAWVKPPALVKTDMKIEIVDGEGKSVFQLLNTESIF